jgi:hypothetical protein
MQRKLYVLLAIALSACAAQSSEVSNSPQYDAIAVTYRYWGDVTASWSIIRGGAGRFGTRETGETTFTVSAADFDNVSALLGPVERHLGQGIPCDSTINDGPYGDITWSRADAVATLDWNLGCSSRSASAVFERMGEAYEAVQVMARDDASQVQ